MVKRMPLKSTDIFDLGQKNKFLVMKTHLAHQTVDLRSISKEKAYFVGPLHNNLSC